jgi:hypothetical protein
MELHCEACRLVVSEIIMLPYDMKFGHCVTNGLWRFHDTKQIDRLLQPHQPFVSREQAMVPQWICQSISLHFCTTSLRALMVPCCPCMISSRCFMQSSHCTPLRSRSKSMPTKVRGIMDMHNDPWHVFNTTDVNARFWYWSTRKKLSGWSIA